MPTSTGAAPKGASTAAKAPESPAAAASAELLKDVVEWLDEAKAEEIVTVDLKENPLSALHGHRLRPVRPHVGAIATSSAKS